MYFKWIPGLCALVFKLPLWFVGQTCGGYVQFRQHAAKRVQLAYARIRTESDSDRELPGTIFDDLLRSYAKQSKDFKLTSRQLESLVDEVFIFLCAGTDTTAIAIAITIVCLCQNPTMMAKLREEVDALKGIPIQEIDAKTITRMPYLDAVIYEGLRIGSPIATYLPRFVSTKNANLGGHYIPRGTKLGINFDVIHRHPKHYPEPDRFIPERWLGEEGKQLHKWFVAFSKGPRRCIGMHLALHEMKLTIAVLVSKFDISMVKPNATLAWRSQMSKIYIDNLRIKVKEVV
ncbi:cytochrome P450 [Thozetella sp. PMI_491]|nr:cytochrome P450 [Thozetella sp. PMI_491]